MKKPLLFLSLTALFVAGCAARNPAPPSREPSPGEIPAGFTLIYSVDSIDLRPQQTAQLVITAKGTVNTGGWSDPRLMPVGTRNGIAEFNFIARRPEGIVTQALEQVTATHTLSPMPDGLDSVKVNGVMRSITQPLKSR